MADNLKVLTGDVDAAIPLNGGIASVKVENHNPLEKNVIKKVGKYTGFPFVSKRSSLDGRVLLGDLYWNGNAMNKTTEFELHLSLTTSDGNNIQNVVNMLGNGGILHFKDFVGRSTTLQYLESMLDTDVDGNSFLVLIVKGFSDNTDYAYIASEEETCFVEFIPKSSYVFQPNVLVQSVEPTRVGNTFTYPEGEYKALINGVLVTNTNEFQTTIAAATTDYKRTDLIYIMPDGLLYKAQGVENQNVAKWPSIPSDGVVVSFINVYGATISPPIPVTNEISVQDIFGNQKFTVSNFMRFEGVSFGDNDNKLITVDPTVPLSAFLDTVNGDDITGTLNNANKPFKTMDRLISSLPVTTGETYSIYIKSGGAVPINRRMPASRNLRFIAYTSASLDFTNCREADGVTHAIYVLYGVGGTWTFENGNVSIICNYSGVKAFALADVGIIWKGTVDTFNWKSPDASGFKGTVIMPTSNFTINNLYDAPIATIFGNQSNNYDLVINNFYVQYGINVANQSRMTIKNIIKVGNANFNLTLSQFSQDSTIVNLGNINLPNCSVAPACSIVNFNGNVNPATEINTLGCVQISGSITGNPIVTNGYLANSQIYKNFSGRINLMLVVESGDVTFEGCVLSVPNQLLRRYMAGTGAGGSNKTNIVYTKGVNVIIQESLTNDLFGLQGGGQPDTTIIVNDSGVIQTNATSLGTTVVHNFNTSSFKEKSKEQVIKSKKDLVNRVLSSSMTYIIDGIINLVAGEYIQVPAGGLTIAGYGFDVSQINKNVAGQSIFASSAGNSGNLVTRDIQYNSGAGSVFNVTDIDGTHAIEFNDVNFIGCSSLGIFTGYRQFTATTCGIYNCSDGLQFDGNWNGVKITNTNVTNFGASGTLFKKGATLSFSNRFYVEMNLQLSSGSKVCDFLDANFVTKAGLQIKNTFVKVGSLVADNTTTPHVFTVTTALFPNISPYSEKADFFGNNGIKNTKEIINDKKVITLDGVSNVFDIPHVLGVMPQSMQLTFSDGANTDFIQSGRTLDASKIRISCDNTPAAGTITVYYLIST